MDDSLGRTILSGGGDGVRRRVPWSRRTVGCALASGDQGRNGYKSAPTLQFRLDRESGGRELAKNDPGPLVAEGDDALDLQPILRSLLEKHRLRVAKEIRLQHGFQLRTCEGPIINIFFTGTVQQPQGRNTHLAREFVEELRAEIAELRHRRWLSLAGQSRRPTEPQDDTP